MEDFALDAEEIIQSGNIPPMGLKLIIKGSDKDLQRAIQKSDSARLMIPEIELEIPPGRARFCLLRDFFREMLDDITSSISSVAGTSHFKRIVDDINDILRNGKEFELVLEDPLANSNIEGEGVVRIEYKRTFDECEELGLPYVTGWETFKTQAVEEGASVFVEYLNKAKRVVGFTGAGVSVESGIPAYRMTNDENIWDNHEIIYFNDFLSSEDARRKYWNMHMSVFPLFQASDPNPAHYIFAELHKLGKLSHVITQNIDGLHEKAGVPKEKIMELHGTMMTASCLDCKDNFDINRLFDGVKDGNYTPACDNCGGLIKENTVTYGQAVDTNNLELCVSLIQNCDLLLIMGSSLLVSPANKLPIIALDNNTPILLLNMGETVYDDYVHAHVDGPAGKTMSLVIPELSDTSQFEYPVISNNKLKYYNNLRKQIPRHNKI